MTPTRAAEIVLGEEACKVCKSCAGYGRIYNHDDSWLCKRCMGHGRLFNTEHEVASHILGRKTARDIYRDGLYHTSYLKNRPVVYYGECKDDQSGGSGDSTEGGDL